MPWSSHSLSFFDDIHSILLLLSATFISYHMSSILLLLKTTLEVEKPVNVDKASHGHPEIIFEYHPFTFAQAFSRSITHSSFLFGLAKYTMFVPFNTGK